MTELTILYSIHPDWHVWPQFVSDGMQTAFTLDSLRSSHPIEVPVRDALDVVRLISISNCYSFMRARSLEADSGAVMILRFILFLACEPRF